ncbi:MAG: inorganic diphosphatase, partial [Pseudomonadota bacterium]
AVISCKPIGVLFMEDEGGADEKLIAVTSNHISGRFTDVNDISDLPPLHRDQISHFFERYKDLEPGKWVKIVRWGDAAEARKAVKDGIAAAARDSADSRSSGWPSSLT